MNLRARILAAQAAVVDGAFAAPAKPHVLLTHAKVGMPGGGLVEVWDVVARKPVADVYEATPDWVVCFVRDARGGHKHVDKRPVLERREGRFEIRKHLSA